MGQMIPDLAAASRAVPAKFKSNGISNGINGASKKCQYDPTFTQKVIAATGPNAHPRLAQIFPSLVRHLHDFAREVNLTVAEWSAAVDLLNDCGRMSDDRRNETQLLCDILGLESLVDEITSKQLATSTTQTPSAILGPFYRSDAPFLPNGSSIVQDLSPAVPWYEQAQADSAFLSGRVLSTDGKPIENAVVDVWHTAPNGLYEQQDSDQPEMNFRGRFRTDQQGRYALYALRPVPYPIPDDGPAGRLLKMLDRHPNRPGHIHFIVSADDHRPLTTQLYDSRDQWVDNDAVFAVKDELVVKFEPREGDPEARWELSYDFVLGRC
ncbi:Intradiol ring-cleavage dioxygenase [Apiosordaria backusii]|uniref:Intradiol ring-cleavage dioxygenase n=1 Tax=Apiosordaria backusii TaxID=314023 RepID=A0AA40F070_9PEZI|nr:Intradiol ring-cleavage dioxygenase [Apiosordaria backusii]